MFLSTGGGYPCRGGGTANAMATSLLFSSGLSQDVKMGCTDNVDDDGEEEDEDDEDED